MTITTGGRYPNMTTRRRTGVGLLALVAGALAAVGVEAQQDFSWNGSVDRGDAVTIRGVNGGIIARRASGSRVVVRAVKTSRHDDVSTVRVEVVEDAQGVLICAVYPSRRDDRPNRCARDREYRNNTNDNDVEVEFTVEVPAGVRLEANTVNGEVTIASLDSEVDAGTVNGDIDLETSGAASAVTVNGSIDARVGRLVENVEFTTVNGSIRLTLPSGVQADIEATTVNGRIETDFPITVRGRWGPRSARGQIGGGGPTLELTTVNGSIELIRGG